MRVYHNFRFDTETGALLRMLACVFRDTLDLCFAGDIPHYGNLLGENRVPRFIAVVDLEGGGACPPLDPEKGLV